MIVKVQIPLDGHGPALVYDRAREHEMLHPIDSEMRAMMGFDVKAYFDAAWDDKAERFNFGARVPNPGW